MIVPSTQQDWDTQIKKYLKDRPLSDFVHKVMPDISYQPFASAFNTDEKNTALNSIGKTIKSVAFKDGVNNQSLITALENGAESIEIKISNTTDPDSLLKGVRLDYILPIFDCDGSEAAQNLRHYLNQNYADKSIKTSLFNNELIESSAVDQRFVVYDAFQNDPLFEMVEICKQIRSNPEKNATLTLHISKDFFLEVARIRALKILIANISRDLNTKVEYKIMAKLSASIFVSDLNNNLIHQTAVALSAIIGGVDILQLAQWDNNNSNYSRLSLHIQNILDLESNLHRYTDVMGGSYFIEDLTDKVATAVWEKM